MRVVNTKISYFNLIIDLNPFSISKDSAMQLYPVLKYYTATGSSKFFHKSAIGGKTDRENSKNAIGSFFENPARPWKKGRVFASAPSFE